MYFSAIRIIRISVFSQTKMYKKYIIYIFFYSQFAPCPNIITINYANNFLYAVLLFLLAQFAKNYIHTRKRASVRTGSELIIDTSLTHSHYHYHYHYHIMSEAEKEEKETVQLDAMGRRVWDKEHFEDKAKARAAGEDDSEDEKFTPIPASQRQYLRGRDLKLDLTKNLNKFKIITESTHKKDSAGYWCNVCECSLRDSQTYLDHINGRPHNRRLGMTMKVEKVGADDVKARLEEMRKAKTKAKEVTTEDVQARLVRLEAEAMAKAQRKKDKKERKRLKAEKKEGGKDDDETGIIIKKPKIEEPKDVDAEDSESDIRQREDSDVDIDCELSEESYSQGGLGEAAGKDKEDKEGEEKDKKEDKEEGAEKKTKIKDEVEDEKKEKKKGYVDDEEDEEEEEESDPELEMMKKMGLPCGFH